MKIRQNLQKQKELSEFTKKIAINLPKIKILKMSTLFLMVFALSIQTFLYEFVDKKFIARQRVLIINMIRINLI